MLAAPKGDNRQAYAEYMRNLYSTLKVLLLKILEGMYMVIYFMDNSQEEKGKITF